jgi:SAM-dependent methyltransferase
LLELHIKWFNSAYVWVSEKFSKFWISIAYSFFVKQQQMKQLIKKYINRVTDNVAHNIISNGSDHASVVDNIAFRVASETLLRNTTALNTPDKVFYGISDGFWYWLNTEGVRKNSMLQKILPATPANYIQEFFTGTHGDKSLREGFGYYKIVKEQYEKYKGDISSANNILDFGCGWGRIIRFFIKDIPSAKIWGCDPEEEMIKICKEQNVYCNFECINPYPPTSFQDSSFDLIYSYSVFSHLSEDLHFRILQEITRILRPGGIYITTTRKRDFIEECASMRERKDLATLNPAVSGSSFAFPDTKHSLSVFDQGLYCHHSYNDKKWPYWGETAIPKKYVLDHWTDSFTFLDFQEEAWQNIIIVQKPV